MPWVLNQIETTAKFLEMDELPNLVLGRNINISEVGDGDVDEVIANNL